MSANRSAKKVTGDAQVGKTKKTGQLTTRVRARGIEQPRIGQLDYQSVFDNAPIGIFQSTPGGQYIHVNGAMARMCGYDSPQDMIDSVKDIGRQVYADAERRREFIRQMDEQGFVERFEARRLRKDGSAIWTSTSARAVEGEGEMVLFYEGFVIDITDRRSAEDAVREREEWFRRLADTTATGIFIYQGDKFVYANRASESLSGYSRDEILGMNFWDVVHPDDKEASHQRGLARQQGIGIPARFEFNIICKDGSTRWVDFTAGLIDWEGKPAVIGTAFDINERKQAEQELRAAREFLETALAQSPSGILIASAPDVAIRMANEAAFKIRGGDRKLLTGIDVSLHAARWQTYRLDGSLCPAEELPLSRAVLRGETIHNEEVIIRDETGTDHWVSANAAPIRDSEGNITDGIVIFHDISGRRHAEQSLSDLSRAVNASGDIVFMTDREGTITSINSRFTDLYGYAPDEVLGRVTPRILKSGKQKQEEYESFWKSILGGKLFRNTIVNQAKDGRLIHIEETVNPFRNDRGEIDGFLAIQRDVSERVQAEELLERNRRRLQVFFEQSLNGFFFCDFEEPIEWKNAPDREKTLEYIIANKRFTDVNQAMLDQYGIAREEFLRLTTKDVFAHDLEQGRRLRRNLFDNGHLHLETYERTQDGAPVWFEGDYVCLYDSQERITGFFGIQTEITERKRIEEALRRSESFARSIVENEPECVKIVTTGGLLRYMNPAGLAMLEADNLESVRGKSIYPIVAPEYRNAFQELTEQVLQGEPGALQFEIVGLKGTRRWLDSLAVPLFDELGNVDALLSITRDITNRKQAEESLRRSEEKYRGLFENVPDGIFRTTPDGEILDANPAFAHMFGFETEAELRQSVRAQDLYVNPADRSLLAQKIAGAGELRNVEIILKRRDGSSFVALENVRTVRDSSGGTIFYEGVLTDITERKRHIREMETLQSVSASLRQAHSIQEMLPVFVTHAAHAVSAAAGSIYLMEYASGDWVSQGWVGLDGKWIPGSGALRHERGEGVTGWVGERGEIYVTDNWRTDPIIAMLPGEKNILDTLHSCITLPLRAEDRVIGVMHIWFAAPHEFTEEEKRLLTAISDMAGNAIQRAGLHEETLRRVNQLQALQTIDRAITTSFEMRFSLEVLLEQTVTQLNAGAAGVLLYRSHTQTLEYAAGKGFRGRSYERSSLRLGEGLAGRVALERKSTQIADLKTASAEFPRNSLLASEDFCAYFGAPLIAKGQIVGVLEIFQRASFRPDAEWLKFLEALAQQAAIAINNAQLLEDLQRSNIELTLAYDKTIEGWSRALDLRDRETEGHTRRVTEMTMKLASAMGFSTEELTHIRRGALLHDIGKMGVPDHILFKADSLTEEEWSIMRRHPQFAYDMLSPIEFLRPALDIPYCHHEKWDGLGYPRGLKGGQIPLSARLFAVVDVWDALSSIRPYRSAWDKNKTLEYIRSLAGSHFDPDIVGAFLKIPDVY